MEAAQVSIYIYIYIYIYINTHTYIYKCNMYIYICNRILLSNKNEIICSMDGPRDYHTM